MSIHGKITKEQIVAAANHSDCKHLLGTYEISMIEFAKAVAALVAEQTATLQADHDALIAEVAQLRAELEHQRDRNYNSFEPDNQCANYKRLCAALAQQGAAQ